MDYIDALEDLLRKFDYKPSMSMREGWRVFQGGIESTVNDQAANENTGLIIWT